MAANDTTVDEAQIETIVVDPDDIIEALRFNGQPPEYTNRRHAVIRLHPPFTAEQSASLFYTEEGNFYPPEMSPKPVHLRPELFVIDDAMSMPDRGTVRAEARDELEAHGEIDDMTEDEIEEYRDSWVEEAFEVWESDVRNRLVSELDKSGFVSGVDETDVLAGVSVKYEQED